MAERARTTRIDGTLRVMGALAGTLPPALLFAVSLARFAPWTQESRFVLGYTLAIPLWVTTACVVFLAKSGARAWSFCAATSLLFAALAYGVPR